MLTITGCSDDLIEVEGDIEEEFGAPYNNPNGYIAVSDGTLLRVVYDKDGIWRFFLVERGNLFDHKEDGVVADDTFDTVYFKGGARWVLYSPCPEEEYLARKRK